MKKEKLPILKDDFNLLNTMIIDSNSQNNILYKSGPYWESKLTNSLNEINQYGISNFRGSDNLIGMSYADNLFLDYRKTYNGLLGKLAKISTSLYPINKIFDGQLKWTTNYANESLFYSQILINQNPKTRELIDKYSLPYSRLGGCEKTVHINQKKYSIHYLDLLEQHDNIAAHIDFNKVNSVFEIGGGFGANIHLLIENYPNIRKILYLDIPPNLYVGTQYLKAFYNDSVIDYCFLNSLDSICFSENHNLEILCIAPWQIENFTSPIDVFLNSHSFVEMPKKIVKNYIEKFKHFPKSDDSQIALNTYNGFDHKTINPDELPKFFKNKPFTSFQKDRLLPIPGIDKNIFFISSSKT